MGERELVPIKRFSDFIDNWKPIAVEEIGKSYNGGGTPKTTKEDYWNGDIPWLQSSDLNERDFFLSDSRKKITELGLINSATKLIKKNSIAVVTRVGFGKLALIPFEYTTSQDFLSISVLNIDKHFAVYVLYKKLQKESKSLQGTSIKGITSGELLTKEIIIPSSSLEQQKIGEFFKVLDERIANQERKIAKVKALKSAYLTEMFPQEGETVPKRRFKGFEDEWKEIDLGSIGSTFSGLSGKTKKDFGHGSAEFVTYMNVFNNTMSDIDDTKKVIYDNKETQLQYGDILFTTSSETPDEVGMSSVWLNDRPDVYLNSFCFGFRSNVKIDYYFVGYLLRANEFREKTEILAQGISRYNISKRKVLELTINLPSLKEQQKIGTFFKNLDNQIEMEEKKLDKLGKMKEAYLEEMFV